MCLTLSVGMLVQGPSKGRANERLSSAPELIRNGTMNRDFPANLSEYISDHFFLRGELITVRSLLAAMIGSSASENVILGTEGWLYYAPTLNDYTGLDRMSDGELAAAVRNLGLIDEFCENHGIEFLFVPVPNKNSIYPQYMPDYGSRAGEHDAQRLFRLLDSAGVKYTDLFDIFRMQPETLYFAHDSHWNSKGAALAADAINRELGRGSSYFANSFSGTEPHSGDLFEMLFPTLRDEETNPCYGGQLSFTREGKDTRPDSITINTIGTGTGTLLAFRDSFGNLLYPYLADSFSRARFSRASSYDLTMAAELGASVILVELVERNLNYLLRYAPVMPAPVRPLPEARPSSGKLRLTAVREGVPDGYVLYSGVLEDFSDSMPTVYLCCGEISYEAFSLQDGGFVAYLPEQKIPTKILSLSGGQAFAYDAIQ